MRYILFYLVLLLSGVVSAQDDPLDNTIRELNEAMENAFNQGDMDAVAGFYLDDAVMLAPNQEPVRGREAIDAYWNQISHPVSWELEIIEVSANERDIYENEYYIALERKPPSWRKLAFRTDTDDPALVYQLGRSTLTSGPEGKERTSEVSFILVWEYTDEGYRILVDTYSW